MKKRLSRSLILVPLVLLIAAGTYLNSLLPIITAYSAKHLCSAIFISQRSAEEVEALDLNFSFIQYTSNQIDLQHQRVTSRFLWGQSTAIYREGFGCTILRDVQEDQLRAIKFPKTTTYQQDTINWPMGNLMPENHQPAPQLAKISDQLMTQKSYGGHPFAFLVLNSKQILAEAYAPEYTPSTRFLSWSMAKSFTNTLAGLLVKDSLWHLHDKIKLPEWQNDDRREITLNNLLQMQSGLKWNEDYGNRSDVTVLLHCNHDFARFAYQQPLQYPVGSKWYYSSGTTNIVNLAMRRLFNNDSAYYAYSSQRLFNPTGMPDAIFEVDPSGTQVGSSYLYATARDFGRFGLLYLNDGVFNGKQILPPGWVDYTTTPAAHSQGNYGAFFWLNQGHEFPSAPADMFLCKGHDGQRIFILPSKDLVIVVLGHSPSDTNNLHFDALLKDILAAI